ncbi:MAG: hypothetical protein ACRC9V_01155 [Aeromonas sp.]
MSSIIAIDILASLTTGRRARLGWHRKVLTQPVAQPAILAL